MAIQYVNNVSYLARATINLNEVEKENFKALMLPKGAEILHLSVEIVEPDTMGNTLDVGLDDEKSFFMSSLGLDTKKSELSSVITSTKQNSFVSISRSEANADGVVVIRAEYFLPSLIKTEY